MKAAFILLALLVMPEDVSARSRVCADGVCFTLLKFERDVRDTAKMMCEMEYHDGPVSCPRPEDIADIRKIAVKHPRALKGRAVE